MPILIEQHRGELESLLGQTAPELSLPLKFGLSAGLYFEYLQRPHDSPSRRIHGLKRNLAVALPLRIARYRTADPAVVLREVLGENALAFNLDRAPTVALMGMEMLAEQLPDFAELPDWQTCVGLMNQEITATHTLYRSTYLAFLREITPFINTLVLTNELSEIVTEWDAFAAQLAQTQRDATQLERASRMLRRLAFREEHFWGNVLLVANR